MKRWIALFLILSTILTIYMVYRFLQRGTCCTAEGFKDSEDQSESNNALLSLMGNLKRINGYLMDSKMWSHRIGLIGMTPVEMARLELNRQKEEKETSKKT